MNNILNIFNWKKYPKNVLLLAIPLFLLGMFLMGSVAYLHWKLDHDFVYLLIFMGGIVLLILGLYPIRNQIITLMRDDNE